MSGCGPDCTCGCCQGIAIATPRAQANPPGRASLSLRSGEYGDFRASILATLSMDRRADGLRSRAADDPSVALIDAAAALLDTLSFAAERVAQENYLPTATETRSLAWLAGLIGYRPVPGVSATVDLAFTAAPAADGAAPPAVVPAGTRVQSVPDPGDVAHSYETGADLEARAAWNAIPLRMRELWTPRPNDRALWLEGVATGLKPGDTILIVGQGRQANAAGTDWDVRVLTDVTLDPPANVTRVTWSEGLGSQWSAAAPFAQVHALRVRSSLFGANAPDAALLWREGGALPIEADKKTWTDFHIDAAAVGAGKFDLDGDQPGVTRDSWVVLSGPSGRSLFRVNAAQPRSRAQYALSGKVTRVEPDTVTELTRARFPLRDTIALCASEPLRAAARPILWPAFGAFLDLAGDLEGLTAGRRIAIAGKLLRLILRKPLTLRTAGGDVTLPIGTSARLVGLPEIGPDGLPVLRLSTDAGDGRVGLIGASFDVAPSLPSDPDVWQLATIKAVGALVQIDPPLRSFLDRGTVRVNANVATATAGETVSEVLGSATGRRDLAFKLKQAPIAFVPTDSDDGRASTLEVRVNDLLWRETRTLAGALPGDRLFATRDDDGVVSVRFGDGIEGAIPPTGQLNVRARYRKGAAGGGNARAGVITTLLTRPSGISDVRNPEAASGGTADETLDSIRDNAPRQVRTLGRAVSVQDYADLARAFGGIAKARADWIEAGPGRGVLLSVAGEHGAAVAAGGDLARRLATALAKNGDPFLPIRVLGYRARRLRIGAGIRFHPDADGPALLPGLAAALRARLGFAARDFGRGLSVDEVAAILHDASPQVIAVNVTLLTTDAGATGPRLFAETPTTRLDAVPPAAELLFLDEAPVLEAIA